ncbi:Presenilin-2 [Physocladia obscura]|uniref:Presenilin-2 n=1 Tax=Physocladia obscura TaxID=109957 RepID=A0AAD5XLA7_9FUNG|nr:Presenilin-2 [Physocladia obscura]
METTEDTDAKSIQGNTIITANVNNIANSNKNASIRTSMKIDTEAAADRDHIGSVNSPEAKKENQQRKQSQQQDPRQFMNADGSTDADIDEGLRCYACGKRALFVCSLCAKSSSAVSSSVATTAAAAVLATTDNATNANNNGNAGLVVGISTDAAKYCSETCQRTHWSVHKRVHASTTNSNNNSKSTIKNSVNNSKSIGSGSVFYRASSDTVATSSSTSSTGSSSQRSTSSPFPLIRNQQQQQQQQHQNQLEQQEQQQHQQQHLAFTLHADTISDLTYYLSQIYKILKPVLACIFMAILWVKALDPPTQYFSGFEYSPAPDIYALNYGGQNSNSSTTSNTVVNPNSESSSQQQTDLLMALKTLGSVIGATLLLYGIFGTIILGVLGLFGYYISVTLLWMNYAPLDYISFAFFIWNFAAVGIVAVFWKGPLWLQQVYMVLMSSMMAYMLTNSSIPPITSWILLAMLAVWDLIAVLCPYGPLRLLIETSKKQNREIPALLYSAGPTTMMAAPDTNRQQQKQPLQWSANPKRSNDTELQLLPSNSKAESIQASQSQVFAGMDEENLRRSNPPTVNNNEGEEEDNHDDDDEDDQGGMKLGLGDFVFYSVLASRAALLDWVPTMAVTIALLTGLNFTIFLLVIWQKALPALPFSIAFGLLFYFTTGLILVPFINNLITMPQFPSVWNSSATSWLLVGMKGGSGMIYV